MEKKVRFQITQWGNSKREVDFNGKEIEVSFWYPNNDNTDSPTLHVGLDHVRASNSMLVEYDFEEDGYKIYMDRTKDADWGCEVVEGREKELVAFIPSWNDDEHDEVVVDRRIKLLQTKNAKG